MLHLLIFLLRIFPAHVGESAFAYPLPDALHELVEEVQIMDGCEAPCAEILTAEEVMQFPARDLFFRTHETAAVRRDRLAILGILSFPADIQSSFLRPERTMPRFTGRNYTIKRVYPRLNTNESRTMAPQVYNTMELADRNITLKYCQRNPSEV